MLNLNKPQEEVILNTNEKKTYFVIEDAFNHMFGLYGSEDAAKRFEWECRIAGYSLRKPIIKPLEMTEEEMIAFIKAKNLQKVS